MSSPTAVTFQPPSFAGVTARFAWLLGFLLAGFLAAFLSIRHLEQTETAELLANARQQQSALLERWLGLTERTLRNLGADFARHESLARFPTAADLAPARAKLSALLATSEAQALWVLGPDGTMRLGVGHPDVATPPPLPIAETALRGLLDGARPPHVFAEHDGTLVELCGEPIPGPVANAPSPGWIILSRPWGAAHLATLSSLTESEVSLAAPGSTLPTEADSGNVILSRPLADWQGRTLRHLVVRHETPELSLLLKTDQWQARVFLVFGLLVLAGLALALNAWVLRPLAAIRESLARDEPTPLAPLRGDRTELGTIATLVTDSFEKRDALRREVAERTRAELALRHSQEELRRTIDERASLGRDLHDGVIQALYAAGMSLAGVRVLLKPDQAEAAVRLEQSRAALNETIRDVRNFITGLEPEALHGQSFAQAVAALLSFMQSVRTFEPTAAIDDAASARLTLSQRAHALQIAREAVSNALRHGAAPAITVALRVHQGAVELEIRDNGRGFIPGAAVSAPGSGHGLANFTRRAREIGAELVLHSEVGVGTTVRLIFPPSL